MNPNDDYIILSNDPREVERNTIIRQIAEMSLGTQQNENRVKTLDVTYRYLKECYISKSFEDLQEITALDWKTQQIEEELADAAVEIAANYIIITISLKKLRKKEILLKLNLIKKNV